MAERSPRTGEVNIEGRWIGVDEIPPILVNQMLGQVSNGEVVLTFGYVGVPPILGRTLEEKEAQAREIDFVPIRPVARIAMTPEKLREIAGVIEGTLANHEQQLQRRSVAGGEGSS